MKVYWEKWNKEGVDQMKKIQIEVTVIFEPNCDGFIFTFSHLAEALIQSDLQ